MYTNKTYTSRILTDGIPRLEIPASRLLTGEIHTSIILTGEIPTGRLCTYGIPAGRIHTGKIPTGRLLTGKKPTRYDVDQGDMYRCESK